MVATELAQVPSDEEYNMAIKPSATEEDAASCIEGDEERDVLETAESEDIDLAALMQRYKTSLSVSMSGEEDASQPLQKVESADNDAKEAGDDDDLDEDEYAARANDIMKRYKLQYALSDDSEQTSAGSYDDDDDDDGGAEEESQVDVDEASENFRECIEDRAEELVNKVRQELETSEVEAEQVVEEGEEFEVEIGEEMGSETFVEDALEHVESANPNLEEEVVMVEEVVVEAALLENVEIGEKIGSESFEEETVEEEHVEEVESETFEEDDLEQVSEEVDDDLEEVESESFEEEKEQEEVAVGEEIQEEEVDAPASNVTEVEASASAATDGSEDLEAMITQLMQENEELKKKKELQKRIYALAQENEKLKKSPKRNALADMACKFDDAVSTAVAKVSNIMVCAPADEDIFDPDTFDPERGTMSEEENENDDDLGQSEYDHIRVLSPLSHMTDENTNYFQSAPAPPSSFQLKMQAYNERHQEPFKPKPTVTVEEALQEARTASGLPTDASLDDAMRRIEEAKQYIKNRTAVLKVQDI